MATISNALILSDTLVIYQNLDKEMNNASERFKKVVRAVNAGYQVLNTFLSDAVNLTNEQIRAETQLQFVLAKKPGMTQEGFNMLKQYAEELQQVTTISDQVGMSGMAQLSKYVDDPANVRELTEAMYNLAVETYGLGVTQKQIQQTADVMGRAMKGHIDSVMISGQKLSDLFSETQKEIFQSGTEAERTAILLDVMNQHQEGLAKAMANTPEGAIKRLSNAWGEVKEAIGFGMAPLIMQFVDSVEDVLPRIKEIFADQFYTIFQLFSILLSISRTVVGFIVDHWSLISPVLWGVVSALVAYKTIAAISAAVTSIKRVALAAQTSGLIAAAAAQRGLNAAILASPIAWVTLGLIALVSIIYLVVAAINRFAGTSIRATGTHRWRIRFSWRIHLEHHRRRNQCRYPVSLDRFR